MVRKVATNMAASKLSDEELLGDTLGANIYTKSSENDLIGEDGDIDEDALLGVENTGGSSVSISFSNDSMHPVSTRRLSRVHGTSHQHADSQQVVLVDEQAFVFDKTDTADLEDELNIAGEDEGQFAVGNQQDSGLVYSEENIYHNEQAGVDEQNLGYSDSRLLQSTAGEMVYDNVSHEVYQDTSGLYSNYSVCAQGNSVAESSGVELGYEQPTEQEEQVHLEYETTDLRTQENTAGDNGPEPSSEQFGSESDSDDDDSRHNRGKFTSERTGVISLASASAREAIPDTLEINDEQAAQIEQFMTDKSRGNKTKNQGRPSVHSRLGSRPKTGPQPLLPPPRLNAFPRALFAQRPRMGGPMQNSLSVTFPGMMNQRGQFLNRMINEMNLFPIRNQNPRAAFSPGGPFPGPGAPFNLALGTQQRFPFQPLRPGRFAGAPLQRSEFLRPEQKMPQPNITRGMSPNMSNAAFPPYRMQIGQGMRPTAGPQPLMKSIKERMTPQPGQPIPSLVQPFSPVPNAPPRQSPHQRLGQMRNEQKVQPQNFGQPSPLQGQQNMSQYGPTNYQKLMPSNFQVMKKHKIYINPRFQTQQTRQQGPQSITKTVPAQVQKAKAILSKAKQTHMKQTQLLSGLKRKSTDLIETVPVKVTKTDVTTEAKTETKTELTTEAKTVTIVEDKSEQGETLDEESQKLKALLEEQKKKRELIKKQKEMARQKQAAQKRKELEEKMKSEGKLTPNVTVKSENIPAASSNAKPISAGVASRLGPPPSQQSAPQVSQSRKELIQQATHANKPTMFQRNFQQTQIMPQQAFTPRKLMPNKLRPSTSYEGQGASSAVKYRPASNLNTQRIPSFNQLRFPVPTSAAQSLVQGTSLRFRGPTTLSDPRYRLQKIPTNVPPPSVQFLTPATSNQDLKFQMSHQQPQPVLNQQPQQQLVQHQQSQSVLHQHPQPLVHQQPQSVLHQQPQPVVQQHVDPYRFQSAPPTIAHQAVHYAPQGQSYAHSYQPPVQLYTHPPPPVVQQHTVSQTVNSSSLYNVAPAQQYHNSTALNYQAQNQSGHTFYSQSPTRQASTSSTHAHDQMPSVGQRIQTIGQHVQPTTGGQIRSIIHNVKPTPQVRVVHSNVSRPNTISLNQQVDVYSGPQKIVILNVPQQATRETIIKICRHFGHVMGANLIRSQNKAIVQFETGEQAAKCVSKCDQKCLHKTRLTVRLLP
ncbi:RNA-binding protein 33-like isoform X2 [Biomphalaria glabrata]|uniref:RNA-binding protein 33-like isoform X2 n=1 Tax=Biomphalaria glabrata TaxID=6526 RepID=A0A9W3B702_BIOGL|nr:RNA-binding protein 33-like isoform X2 [Biomphalaria glabrata]